MSQIAQLGERLIDNGYSILPIMPSSKAPGCFTRGEWRLYSGWQKHCMRATTEHELAIWATWPNAGIGIACGHVVGIDIDETDGASAHRIEQRARELLGDTPCMRVGSWPKRLLLYRAAEPFGSISDPLEVLAVGRQFVAFARHPDTDKPYLWPDASPADIPAADLPTVDLAMVQAFLGPMQLRMPVNGSDRTCSHINGNGELGGTLEAIADALRFLPNDDLDYRDWVRLALALKGALGEDGWPLFEAWSEQSNKHVPDTTWRTWQYCKPRNIGAGTIYHYAFTRGWNPPPSMVLNNSSSTAHPAQALLDKLRNFA